MSRTIRIILTLSLLLFLTIWSTPATFAQDAGTQVHITQVDNSKFPQVTVYVSVTDASGEPIGIDPNTIQLSENGQALQTTNVNGSGDTKAPATITTLLVIDVSGSMANGNKMDGAKTAAKAYIDQMRPGDQAGVIAFNTDVKTVQDVTTDHQALIKAIDSLQPAGNTAMFDGLLKSVETLANISGRKAIILLSDGIDNRSKTKDDDVVKSIGSAGLTISTIGLGDPKQAGNNFGLDESALKSLAERAGGAYSFATDPAALASVYQLYGRTLQSEYAFTYTSPSILRDGVNRTLTVSINGGALSANSHYNPGGVLPEVPAHSWPLFAVILIVLLALLVTPMLVGKGMQAMGAGRKKGRVKLSGQPANAQTRGRVKMK